MEIIWLVDTNIAWGLILQHDHLHRVAKCVSESKEIHFLPAVAAEIKATLDKNVAKIMAFALTGEKLPNSSGLARKIAEEVHSVKRHYPKMGDTAIVEFERIIREYVSAKLLFRDKNYRGMREIDKKDLRQYVDKNPHDMEDLSKAYKKYAEKVFSTIINRINEEFQNIKNSRDRGILIDLVMTAYYYPDTKLCFLTNDAEFFKKWKRVYDSKEYKQFITDNSIRYGIVFHYLPDLENESVEQYEIYPSLSEDSISLYDVLIGCL